MTAGTSVNAIPAQRSAPAPAAGAVDALVSDVPCMACGYNLRTQSPAGVCPECGRPVRETLDFPHLRRGAPRWLTSLVDSTILLLLAVPLLACAAAFASASRDDVWGAVTVAAAWGLCWFSFWMLTRPEPDARPDRRARARAWAMRAFATGPFVAFAMPRLSDVFSWRYAYYRLVEQADWAFALFLLLLLCSLPATSLYYDHLRRAAIRLPSRALAWQASILRWALPLTMLLSFAGMAILGRPPQGLTDVLLRVPMPGLGSVGDAAAYVRFVWASRDPLARPALLLTPGVVCMAWGVLTLIQFCLALAAARAARQRTD
jgi:hypothetical protein